MEQHCSEAFCTNLFRLPMAMAQDATAVCGIDFNGLCLGGKLKGWTSKKIADDGLYVTVKEPRMGLELSKPRWKCLRRLRRRASCGHRGVSGRLSGEDACDILISVAFWGTLGSDD